MSDKAQPSIPDSLGNLFLQVSEDTWYIRWNGKGAYVGSKDGRKRGALIGLRLLKELLAMSCWEGSPSQLVGLVSGLHANGTGESFSEGMASVGVEGCYEGGRNNPGFGITTLSDDLLAKQVLRNIESAQGLIARSLPELANYLKAAILPPTKWDGTWTRNDPDSRWTCGQFEDFVAPKPEVSNTFRRESPTEWYIRFGEHECRCPHSEGMEILSVLLQHPAEMLSGDRILQELGNWEVAANATLIRAKQQNELTRLVRLAEEFREELKALEDYAIDDDGRFFEFPKTAGEIADALMQVVSRLTEAAKHRFVESQMRSRGIKYSSGELIEGSFKVLTGKLRRCERLILEFREWERRERDLEKKRWSNGGDPALQSRLARTLRNSITDIESRNSYIGAYFKKCLRIHNHLFFMDIATRWRISIDPSCDFSTGNAHKIKDFVHT